MNTCMYAYVYGQKFVPSYALRRYSKKMLPLCDILPSICALELKCVCVSTCRNVFMRFTQI